MLAAVAVAFLAPAAQATPISFYNDAGTPTAARFTVGCGSASGDCSGLLAAVSDTSPLAWSSTIGQMLGGPSNASPTSETNFVNDLLGTAFASTFAPSSGNLAPTNSNSFEFSLDTAYLLIKVGDGPTHQGYALLRNLDGKLDLWFTATGQAGGLSHYITFDGSGPTPVPEPTGLRMFGLGVLLICGFLGLRRRYN
ncbi:hypothetical protein EAH75_07465 [Rhodanobacter glycinis]|uniref:PEP-CTERM protein-sorting domain-containing protein n=2 Tax=Rhodanobacter glycinis TaxID=582702 RepID=A0A502CFS0_9GAMM|nr:hypothetical protein EAH88_05665 [Rhodanobacter glycinis]TPG51212.1 hypothetical protein EAH75_07465 [Rhodanobacter glycinis]